MSFLWCNFQQPVHYVEVSRIFHIFFFDCETRNSLMQVVAVNDNKHLNELRKACSQDIITVT